MGRSFISVRQGVNRIADRWARTSRKLNRRDRAYGEAVARMARMYASESFVACNDPLEAAVFSVMVGMIKRREEWKGSRMEERDEQAGTGVLGPGYWT